MITLKHPHIDRVYFRHFVEEDEGISDKGAQSVMDGGERTGRRARCVFLVTQA